MIFRAIESTAAVLNKRKEAGRRDRRSHVVVPDSLVGMDDDAVSLTNVDKYTAEGDGFDFDAIHLDYIQSVIVDAKPEGEKTAVIDEAETVSFAGLHFGRVQTPLAGITYRGGLTVVARRKCGRVDRAVIGVATIYQ